MSHQLKPYQKPELFVRCPCSEEGEQFRVDHLYEMMAKRQSWSAESTQVGHTAGPWVCYKCGAAWWIDVNPDKFITLTESKECWRKAKAILKLDPEDMEGQPLYLVTECLAWSNDGNPPIVDHDHEVYFFEEHTCPTNWIKNVDAICPRRAGAGLNAHAELG